VTEPAAPVPALASGIDPDTGEWTPAFPGQRPPLRGAVDGRPFPVKHGAYSMLRISARAKEIAVELRELVPLASPADSACIDALSVVLAQLETASLALAVRQRGEVDALAGNGSLAPDQRDDLRRLSADARGWALAAARFFDMLGLSPSSRVKLGLDIANTRRSLSLIEYWEMRGREGDE
jgi:hypothetical protein